MTIKTTIESLTLTINGNTCELFTHKVEHEDADGWPVEVELYRAQDLMKAAGLDKEKAEKTLWHFKQTKTPEIQGSSFHVVKGKGKTQGTYLTKLDLFELAAYIDKGFHRAVFQAFEALTEGRIREAMGITVKQAIAPELKVKLKESTVALNDAIAKWNDKQESSRANGHLYTMFHDHIICQCVTGGSLKSLKASSSCPTLSAMMVKGEQLEHVEALLRANEMVTVMLNAGMDYYTIRAVLLPARV